MTHQGGLITWSDHEPLCNSVTQLLLLQFSVFQFYSLIIRCCFSFTVTVIYAFPDLLENAYEISEFLGGRNLDKFFLGLLLFTLPQIPSHHFSTLISFISFHFFSFSSRCDIARGVVGRHAFYSQMYNIGASQHFIPHPSPVSDMSWDF